MQETQVQPLGGEDSLEESMATHSSIPMDRETWQAVVHRVTQSQIQTVVIACMLTQGARWCQVYSAELKH